VVLGLWGAVLLGKPWRRITRRALWKLLIVALAWVALNVVRLPSFYKIETTGYPIVIPDTVVYMIVGFNLTVLVWIFLLRRGSLWARRPRTLRLVSPVLVTVMTTAVLYLIVICQPNGPQIVDVFPTVYHRWVEDLRRPDGPKVPSAEAHENKAVGVPGTVPTIAH